MNEPTFLMSSERSGSNLLRVMLDSHPDFSAQHSPHLVKTFVPLLANYGSLHDETRLRQLAADMRKAIEIQLRDWPFIPSLEDVLAYRETPSFAGLLNSFYTLAASHAEKPRSFIKDNGAIPFSTELAIIFPNAKFIHLVRDARDMALSWKKSPGHPGGVKQAAKMWRDEQNQALHFQSMVFDQNRLHRLHYEDLVAYPKQELSRICEFLETSFDERMLNFHQGAEAKASAESAVGWANLTKPLLSKNTGKYLSELSTREQLMIERIALQPLHQLGYETRHQPTRSVLAGVTPGRLFRAGRVAIKQLLRGSAGMKELQKRTQRLKGLKEIMVRMESMSPTWPKSTRQTSSDSNDTK